MVVSLVQINSAPDLVDQVYRSLLDAISSGSLAPGQRLTQEDLARRLNVSRQPVLQALRLLKKDGFVHDAPGRGVWVAPLDVEWTGKVYQVRGALDMLAARLAAEKRFRVDPGLIDHGRKAARGTSIEGMLDADMAFHQAIYAASGNPLIAQSADQHWRHLRRAMGAVLQAQTQRESLWDEHQAIADAIAAGDIDGASRLSDTHGAQASANLRRRLVERLDGTTNFPSTSRSTTTPPGDTR